MGEGKRIQKKEIAAGTVVKAVITGYIAYGILIGFIVFMVGLTVDWTVNQIPNADFEVLSISLPLMGALLLYYIVHGVSKLSIYDVFSKCKTNPDGVEKICTRLNLFVLICIVLSVVFFITTTGMTFSNQRRDIEISSMQYNQIYSKEFANQLTNDMLENYEMQKQNTIMSIIILELGVVVSFISLIPYQKKLIEKYNKF